MSQSVDDDDFVVYIWLALLNKHTVLRNVSRETHAMCCSCSKSLCHGCAGSVIPSAASLYLSPSVISFRARTSSPKGGEGLLVLQAPEALMPVATSSDGRQLLWTLMDDNNKVVDQKK